MKLWSILLCNANLQRFWAKTAFQFWDGSARYRVSLVENSACVLFTCVLFSKPGQGATGKFNKKQRFHAPYWSRIYLPRLNVNALSSAKRWLHFCPWLFIVRFYHMFVWGKCSIFCKMDSCSTWLLMSLRSPLIYWKVRNHLSKYESRVVRCKWSDIALHCIIPISCYEIRYVRLRLRASVDGDNGKKSEIHSIRRALR